MTCVMELVDYILKFLVPFSCKSLVIPAACQNADNRSTQNNNLPAVLYEYETWLLHRRHLDEKFTKTLSAYHVLHLGRNLKFQIPTLPPSSG